MNTITRIANYNLYLTITVVTSLIGYAAAKEMGAATAMIICSVFQQITQQRNGESK